MNRSQGEEKRALTAAKLDNFFGLSGNSTPQQTLTPQSSCKDFDTNSSIVSSHHEGDIEHACHDVRESGAACKSMPAWLMEQGTSKKQGICKKQARVGGACTRNSLRSCRHETIIAASVGNAAKLTRSQLRARGDAVLASVRGSFDPTGSGAGPAEHAVPSTQLNAKSARRSQKKQGFAGVNVGGRALPGCHLSADGSQIGSWQFGDPYHASRRSDFFGGHSCGKPESTCVVSLAATSSWEVLPMKINVTSLTRSSLSGFSSPARGSLPCNVAPPPGL